MKLRNGFVSNSSSASFVIAFPQDHNIDLKDIEDWVGGFNTDIPQEERDGISFLFWKTQYFDEENWKRSFDGTGETYDYHYCDAPYNYIQENRGWNCPGYISEEVIDIPQNCKNCKYHKVEQRVDRGDDFYQVKSYVTSDRVLKWLEEHKDMKIVCLDIDDNETPKGIPYDIAVSFTSNAWSLLNKEKNACCLEGK